MNREFKISEVLSLKLEDGETNIYVRGQFFEQCKALVLNIPKDEVVETSFINSIDSFADVFEKVEDDEVNSLITPEEEFWGHCSNLQVWYENDFDSRLLSYNLAFPLLKKLADLEIPKATQVFKEEIVKKFKSGYINTIIFLINNGYLTYLSGEEESYVLLKDNPILLKNIEDGLKSSDKKKSISILHFLIRFNQDPKAVQILKKKLLSTSANDLHNYSYSLLLTFNAFNQAEQEKMLKLIESLDPFTSLDLLSDLTEKKSVNAKIRLTSKIRGIFNNANKGSLELMHSILVENFIRLLDEDDRNQCFWYLRDFIQNNRDFAVFIEHIDEVLTVEHVLDYVILNFFYFMDDDLKRTFLSIKNKEFLQKHYFSLESNSLR